ncbi:hypothetical protein LEMA_P071940.1 [Plenodomus lingam JN3]|uniref:DUF1772-domain-containing protein n=1 Tax=Leptosphaeria maculans (strain JN3 / isolate v23.1.3 / race Av1-4-5-6-7-8) TaxID=985895 RepID=E4ZK91_LEPMJ|nr:hypothetical protein LEMA_P071940.1 [Plenodomus lingam JN3]CBX91686.1 hypothetical protein LEMA_P071940.1 [Plenodomus lingam JN3]
MPSRDIVSGPSTPLGLLIAQTLSFAASCSNAALSLIAVPAVLQAPAPLAAKQWYTVLTRGGTLARPLAMLSALATAYAAYTQPRDSIPFKLHVAATILIPSIVPFTFAFIVPTNNKLIAKKDEFASLSQKSARTKAGMPGGWDDVEADRSETVHALIDRWAVLNLLRVGLVAGGSLCAVLAALHP